MHHIPIIDLHCDLLSYLEKNPIRTPFDANPRCSLDHLKKGNVSHQTLAIFAHTKKGSVQSGLRQVECFKKIIQLSIKEIIFLTAIENGSSFFEEKEPLDLGFKRFTKILPDISPVLYLSLTWKFENRFGGGNLSSAGLKRDGELLLEFLEDKNIAIDLSHTSDQLAFDILNFIDKKSLKLNVLASHSNFRKVYANNRNLSDEIAKEINKRKGIIGLNFVTSMIGKKSQDFNKHIDHALDLKLQDLICFGADFFDDLDINDNVKPFFFSDLANASVYPYVLNTLLKNYDQNFLEKIANKNAFKFFDRQKKLFFNSLS